MPKVNKRASLVAGLKGLAKTRSGKSASKPAPKPAPPGDHNSITFDSPNVVDLSKGVMPNIPPKPEQPQLPVDDPFRKYRSTTT